MNIADKSIHALLIEDNPGDGRLITEMLREVKKQKIIFQICTTLAQGLQALSKNDFNVILLDLNLPDSMGFETFVAVHNQNSQIPIVILTGTNDEELAIKSVRSGAQDYLVKGKTDTILFERSILYAIQRQHAEHALLESEKRMQIFLNSTSDFSYLKDENFRHVIVNRALCKFYGMTETEIIGKTDYELMSEKDAMECRKTDEEALHLNSLHISEEIIGVRYYETMKFPVEISKGKKGVGAFIRDITERKRAEIEVSASEIRYRRLFESAKDGILIIDADTGRVVDVNPNLIDLLGYSRHEFMGKTIWELGLLTDIFANKAKFLQLQQQEYVRYEDVSLETADGRQIHVEFVSNVYLVDHLKVIQCNIRDITERKLSKEALYNSEQKFRRIFEDHIAVKLLIDPDSGKIIDANNSAAAYYGWNREELKQMKINQINVLPQEEIKKEMEKVLSNKSNRMEFKHRLKDGSIRDIEVSSSAIQIGEKILLHSIIHDITKRKQAELKLLKLTQAVQQSPNAVVITDVHGNIEYINPTVTLNTGYSLEEVIGKNPRIFSSGEKPKSDYKILWDTIITGKTWTGEFHNKRKNGELFWEQAKISPILNEQGEITNYLGVKEDITERKKLFEQLLQTQKVESIGTLASGIAHDFNNVLGIILAYLGMLESQKNDPKIFSESLNVMKRAVERGAHLVRQILTFARKTETTILPMSLKDLVNEMSIMIQETFPKIIEVRILLESTLPYISADKTKIHQVLLNLCINARDAMPNGGVLTISAKTISENRLPNKYSKGNYQRYIALSVADSGIGMDQYTIRQIFDPFFTTKSVDKGTGLGLSVVYGIAELHNGYIDVQSEVGKGSTFTLYLPLIENDEENVSDGKKTEGELRGGTETILFVEDEESLISMIKIILETNGYTVLEARNGEEGVNIYENNMEKIHMVLTDMGLPKLTGFEEFKKIKKLNPDVKVVFASGYFDPNLKSELFKDGVKAFIQKPYDANEILRTIREVLDQN